MLLWNKLSKEGVQMEQMKEKGKPSEKNVPMEPMKEKDKPSEGIVFQRKEPCNGGENLPG